MQRFYHVIQFQTVQHTYSMKNFNFLKFIPTLLIFVLQLNVIFGQVSYSFISDKRFNSPDELLGYEFKPSTLVYPNRDNPDNNREIALNAGEFSFRVTRNYLIIEAENYDEYKGAYSVNSINPANYGFKIDLMNARNPSIQGHLKIILNDRKEVDAYIFKSSPKQKEVIFYQAQLPDYQREIDETYFSDAGEVIVTDSSMWQTRVYPLFELEQTQRRLQPEDSLSISFEVDTVITNKKKNKKKAVYSIVIRVNEMNDNGKLEMQRYEFPVQKTKERRSDDPRDRNQRYRIEFEVKKLRSGKIFMYLDENRAVYSIVVIGETFYTVRGID